MSVRLSRWPSTDSSARAPSRRGSWRGPGRSLRSTGWWSRVAASRANQLISNQKRFVNQNSKLRDLFLYKKKVERLVFIFTLLWHQWITLGGEPTVGGRGDGEEDEGEGGAHMFLTLNLRSCLSVQYFMSVYNEYWPVACPFKPPEYPNVTLVLTV